MPSPILTLPDSRLRKLSEPVSSFSQDVLGKLGELERSMRAGPGGVGIAAPQIGWQVRAVIVDCRMARHQCRNHGLLHLINPVITLGERQVLGREGCLSVPDWVGMVPRAAEITVCYQDASGQQCKLETSGFEARVIQHEADHLDGILFIDRVVSVHDLIRRPPAD